MEIVITLYCLGINDGKKVCTCSVKMQFFQIFFNPHLVDIQMQNLQTHKAHCVTKQKKVRRVLGSVETEGGCEIPAGLGLSTSGPHRASSHSCTLQLPLCGAREPGKPYANTQAQSKDKELQFMTNGKAVCFVCMRPWIQS